MNEIGSWWFSLEMRKLRLRQNIKALYLYDLVTEEQMLLYKRGKVTIQDEYILTTTIDSRIEVWILWTIQPKPKPNHSRDGVSKDQKLHRYLDSNKRKQISVTSASLGPQTLTILSARKVRLKVNAEESICLNQFKESIFLGSLRLFWDFDQSLERWNFWNLDIPFPIEEQHIILTFICFDIYFRFWRFILQDWYCNKIRTNSPSNMRVSVLFNFFQNCF